MQAPKAKILDPLFDLKAGQGAPSPLKPEIMVEENTDRKDLGRGALAMLAGFVPRSIAGLSFLFLAGNLFGAEALGAFFIATASVEILGALCVLGMKRSLYPFLERAEPAAKDDEAIARVTSAALLCSLGLAVPLSLICFLTFEWLTPGHATNYLAFALPLIVLADVLLAITRHRRVMVYYILSRSVLEPWVKAILCGLFGLLGVLKFGLTIAYLGGLAAAAATAIVGYYRLFGLKIQRPDLSEAKYILSHSIPTMVTDLIQMASRRIDLILLGFIAGPGLAGPYGVAKEITTNVQKTHELFAPVLAPITAQTLARHGGQRAGQQLAQVNRWIFTLQMVQWLFFIPMAVPLLSWAGSGFEGLAPALLVLLGAEVIIASTLSAELPIIFTKPWLATLASATGTLFQIAGCFALIPLFEGLGAAYAATLSAVILASARLFLAWYLTRASCVSSSFFKPLTAAMACLPLLLWLTSTLQALHPLALVTASVACALIPFALVIFLLRISPEDRGLLKELFGKSN